MCLNLPKLYNFLNIIISRDVWSFILIAMTFITFVIFYSILNSLEIVLVLYIIGLKLLM